MILSERQIAQLDKQTREKLLLVLYTIEDELQYKCKNVSKTINYIQQNTDTSIIF